MQSKYLFLLLICAITSFTYENKVQAESIVKVTPLSNKVEGRKQDIVLEYLNMSENKTLSQPFSSSNKSKMKSQGLFFDTSDNGAPFLPVPERCNYNNFENELWNGSPKEFGHTVSKYMQSCGGDIANHGDTGIHGQLTFLFSNYNLLSLPNTRRVEFQFNDGTRLEAFISVKDLETKRPWVIAKCGVFCSLSENSGVASFYMNFFDQSPFNIIFLENRTGNNFIEKNDALMFGGYLESADFFHVSEWLQYQSEYKNTVDSVHAFGMSLGGNAALLISQLADKYQANLPKPLFNSAIAACPVVNLDPTLDDIYGISLKGDIFSSITWSRFQDVKSHLPEAADYLNGSMPWNNEFPGMVKEIGFRYTNKYFSKNPDVPLEQIKSVNELMDRTRYAGYNTQAQVPTFVLASNDDFVVDSSLNARSLNNSFFNNDPNVGVAIVDEGTHCAFSQAYSTHLVSRILRDFIMKQSHALSRGPVKNRTDYDFKLPQFDPEHIHIGQYWKVSKDADHAELVFVMHDPTSWICPWQDPLDSLDACKYDVVANVPFKDLQKFGISFPKTDVEVQRTTRMLNAAVKAKIDFNDAYNISGQPNGLEWMNF